MSPKDWQPHSKIKIHRYRKGCFKELSGSGPGGCWCTWAPPNGLLADVSQGLSCGHAPRAKRRPPLANLLLPIESEALLILSLNLLNSYVDTGGPRALIIDLKPHGS